MAEVLAETDRLILRDWEDEDEARFYDVMNREEVMQHLGGLQPIDEWRAAYSRVLGYSRDFGHTFWVMEDRKTGDILGFCGIKRVNSPGAGALAGMHEIGWRLRPEAWGKGIAKEAAIAALDLAFNRFRAPHVIALTIPANESSWGLMRRLGMKRREDLDFTDERFGPDVNPQTVYWIDSADWPAARAAAIS